VIGGEFHTGARRTVTKVTGVEEDIMMRKLIAVAAVSGSLVFAGAGVTGVIGTAGAAGAAVPASTAPAAPAPALTPATHARRCARAERLATRIDAREAKAAVWLPKAQAREAKATAAGHPKVATRIANRITRVQKLVTKGDTVLARIETACGSAASAS
jgi:hypothetical protein